MVPSGGGKKKKKPAHGRKKERSKCNAGEDGAFRPGKGKVVYGPADKVAGRGKGGTEHHLNFPGNRGNLLSVSKRGRGKGVFVILGKKKVAATSFPSMFFSRGKKGKGKGKKKAETLCSFSEGGGGRV